VRILAQDLEQIKEDNGKNTKLKVGILAISLSPGEC